MSAAGKRDLLDHLVVRVPPVATVLGRAIRRVPPSSRLRQRLLGLQVKRAFAAMARSDVDLVIRLYEPDAEVLVRGMAGVGVDDSYHGHDGIRALYANVDEVFDDWSWAIRAIADGGDRIAVRTDFVGHGRGSGVTTDIRGGGTAVRLSERGLATWQTWFVEQGGWEKALAAVGLSEPDRVVAV